MSANQKIILIIFIVYLILNAAIGIIFSKRQNKKQHTSSEKKFFIGGRNMNGLLLAMTTMATYTSVSSFISGPGAAGLTYGYAQACISYRNQFTYGYLLYGTDDRTVYWWSNFDLFHHRT